MSRLAMQQINARRFDIIDALRRGEITSTQANRLEKVLRERERQLHTAPGDATLAQGGTA